MPAPGLTGFFVETAISELLLQSIQHLHLQNDHNTKKMDMLSIKESTKVSEMYTQQVYTDLEVGALCWGRFLVGNDVTDPETGSSFD
jgi:hypothetical protein